jgi:predicted MFS family arabinose efflux permease
VADPGPRYRDTIRHPISGRLWASAAVSELGDYVGIGALLILAYERSGGRVIGPAAIFAIQALPALLSGALAGSWLDQVPRRLALTGTYLAGAPLLVLPIFAPGILPVLVAAGGLGVIRVAFTSVRSGVIAEAVPEDRRGNLFALIGVTGDTSQVVGYFTGGAVAVLIGAAPALAADALTFVVAAAIAATLPLPPPQVREPRPPVTQGLKEIWPNPVLRLLAVLVWLSATVTAPPGALAAGVTGGEGFWTPIVLAAGPAGQAVTMAILGRYREIERPSFQLTHLTWFALAFGIAALGDSPLWFAVGNVMVGSGAAWLLGPQTLFVRIAPPARMAQITATMIAVIIAAEGAGTLVFAAIADRWSVAQAYWVAGVLLLGTALVGWWVKSRIPEATELDDIAL